jgi:hypothetical protein
MAADVESLGEKIVSNIRAHHVRKVLSAGGSDDGVKPGPQDITERVLRGQTPKNVPGAKRVAPDAEVG